MATITVPIDNPTGPVDLLQYFQDDTANAPANGIRLREVFEEGNQGGGLAFPWGDGTDAFPDLTNTITTPAGDLTFRSGTGDISFPANPNIPADESRTYGIIVLAADRLADHPRSARLGKSVTTLTDPAKPALRLSVTLYGPSSSQTVDTTMITADSTTITADAA